MRSINDSLYQSGLTIRLRVVQAIGALMSSADLRTMAESGELDDMHYVGDFIEQTVQEAFTLIGEVEDEQDKEVLALRSQVPQEPRPLEQVFQRFGVFSDALKRAEKGADVPVILRELCEQWTAEDGQAAVEAPPPDEAQADE